MNDTKPLYEEESLMQRIKESPRTVSALIIILIVAAAIYAFSGDNNNQGALSNQAAQVENSEAAETEAATGEGETSDQPSGQVAAETDQAAIEVPEARKTNEGYVEVAQAGDGYTHLARRAATKWLSENQASYSVTDEHRIFIEDYIQNQIGTEGMEIGQEHLITFQLVQEAVEAAGELNESQLDNLSQYTSALE